MPGHIDGRGTYFAAMATESQKYGNTLWLVRVWTGIYTKSNRSAPGIANLKIIPGSHFERVHSVVDKSNSPTIYVI